MKHFDCWAAHPRLIRRVEQVFGESLYMHQFKINAKSAFDGEVWQWHQDYGTWARDDGMPEPRAMNIAVFVDEVLPINGPLMLVPRSHKEGVLQAGHDVSTTSYPLWTLDNATVERLVRQGGIVTPTGKPGAVLMFHGNLVHGSAGNITPYPRKIVYLTLNAVSNHIRTPTRPDWIAHRDFRPIEPVRGRCTAARGIAQWRSPGGGGVRHAVVIDSHGHCVARGSFTNQFVQAVLCGPGSQRRRLSPPCRQKSHAVPLGAPAQVRSATAHVRTFWPWRGASSPNMA